MVVQRYLARLLALRFGFCVFAGLAFFLLADLIENAKIIPKAPALSQLLELYLLKVPFFLFQAVPLALVMAVLLTFGHVVKTGELTALLVSGRHPLRLMAPTLLFGCACVAAMFALGELVIPSTTRAADALFLELTGKQPGPYADVGGRQQWFRDAVQDSASIYPTGTHILYDVADAEPGGVLREVRVFVLSPAFEMLELWQAKDMRWVGPPERWELHDGLRRRFGETPEYEHFASRTVALPADAEAFAAATGTPDELSLGELVTLIRRRRWQGYDATAYEIGLHQRLARPASAWLVCLLVLPLGFATKKGHEVAMQMAKASGVAAGFIGLELLGAALGARGFLPVWLGVWLPNLTAAVVGLPLIARVVR